MDASGGGGDGGSVSTGQSLDQERRSKGALAALDGAVPEEREPLHERVLQAALGTIAFAANAPTASHALYYFLRVVGLLQLLLFALPPDATWRPLASASGDPAAIAAVFGSSLGSTALGSAATIVPNFQGFLLSVAFTPWPPEPGGTAPVFPPLTLWMIAAFFALTLILLFAYETARLFNGGKMSHTQQPFRNLHRGAHWMASSLQLGIIVSVFALPIPLVGNLLAPLVCAPDTSGAAEWGGLECWSTAHIVVFSFSLVIVLLLVGFLLLAAALSQSRSPDPKAHPTAVAHGRVEAAAMTVQLVLTVLFVSGGGLSPWVRVLINLVGGLVLFFLYASFMPYIDPSLNRFQSMLYAVFIASCVAQLLAVSLAASATAAFAAAVGGLLWAFVVPLSAYVGYNLADARWRALTRSKEVSSSFQVELRLRFLLAEALRLEQTTSSTVPLGREPVTERGAAVARDPAANVQNSGPAVAKVASNRTLGNDSSSAAVTDGVTIDFAVSASSSVASSIATCPMGFSGPLPAGHGEAAQPGEAAKPGEARQDDDGGATPAPAARIPTPNSAPPYGLFGAGLENAANPMVRQTCRGIMRLLNEALETFPSSPIMQLFAAHYVRAVQGNVYLERSHLRAAERLSDASTFDMRFFSLVRQRRVHEEDARAATGRMTVELRLYFDWLQEQAALKMTTCRGLILSFWALLCDRKPDLRSLQSKGAAIYAATRDTEAVFKELLDMVPTSVPVMRAYAEFLLDVSNNPSLANELMTDADQLEDESSKSLTARRDVDEFRFGAIVNFDMGADGIGLLKVNAKAKAAASGDSRTASDPIGTGLGTVTYANTLCLKVLGFSGVKRELVGKDMNLLIPAPVAAIHPRYLTGFVANGMQRISGTSRINYIMHRLGYLVPIREHVQATGDEWLMALEEIPAPHMSIFWVQGRDTGYRIAAACRRGFAAFGLSALSLRTGTISLQSFLPDTAAKLRMILLNPGAVVQLQNLAKGGFMRSNSFAAATVNAGGGGSFKPDAAAPPLASVPSLASLAPIGAGTTGANASSGYFTAHVQELTVPLVAGSIYIVKFIAATSAEVRAAIAAGTIPPPPPRQNSESNFGSARALLSRKTKDDSDDGDGSDNSMSDADSRDAVDDDSADEDGNGDDSDEAGLFDVEEALGLGPHGEKAQAVAGNFRPKPSSEAGPPPRGALKRPSIASQPAASAAAGGGTKPRIKLGRGLAKRAVAMAKNEKAQRRFVIFSGVGGKDDVAEGADEDHGHYHDAAGHIVDSGKAKAQAYAQKAFRDQLEILVTHEVTNEASAAEASAKGGDAARPAPQAAHFRSGASVASGGSEKTGGSSGSMMSPAEMIRRGVKARSRQLEASLVRLRRSLLIVFAIVCATNVASYIVTQVLTTQLLTNLGSLRNNSQRAVLVQRTASAVQLLVAHGDTSLGFPLYDLVEGYSWARERMRSCITDVETLHSALYIEAQGSGNAAWLRTYVEPVWPVIDLSPGTYVDRDSFVATQRNVSLSDIVIEFSMRVHAIWWYSSNDFNASDINVFWIENNAPFALMSALNASLFYSSTTSATLADTVQVANIIVLAVALSVFLLVTALVIVPSVAEVLKEQREVFNVFSKVPVKVIRHLRDALAERISQLKRAADGEDDIAGGGAPHEEVHTPTAHGDNLDKVAGVDAHVDDGAKSEKSFGGALTTRFRGAGLAAAVHLMKGSRRNMQAAAAAEEAKRLEEESLYSRGLYCLRLTAVFFGCTRCLRTTNRRESTASSVSGVANAAASTPSSTLRDFSRTSSGFALLVLRMAWPMLAFSAYYCGMFVQNSNAATAASYSRAAVLWSVELEVLAPTVGYNMRNTLFYLEAEWTRTFTDKLDDSISVMASISESIAYGDPARGLQSLVATSPGTHTLLMINGCVAGGVSAEECVQYGPQPYYGCNYFYEYSMCSLGTDNTNISTPTFFFGIVGTGLYPALFQFFLTGKDFVAVRRTAFALGPGAVIYFDCNHYTPTSVALHPGGFMNEMANSYLAGGLADLSATIYSEATTAIGLAQQSDLLAVIFSNLALLVFYFGLYLPLIEYLDGEIKKTRFLLLLVPEEVAKGVPAVVQAGRALAQGTS